MPLLSFSFASFFDFFCATPSPFLYPCPCPCSEVAPSHGGM